MHICTARQCWPIGEFGTVFIINQGFTRFKENIFSLVMRFSLLFIGQFSFSLLFIDHNLGSTFTGTGQNGPNYRTGPKRA